MENPEELGYVKNTTKGHPIVLGRKNLESIGRALPDRRNIILTRDKSFTFTGCDIVHSIEDVFELCKNQEEIFIFGGEKIYNLFLPYVEKMYITKIHHEFVGDTFFPEVNFDEWKEISVEKGIMNDKNPYNYYFYVCEKETFFS